MVKDFLHLVYPETCVCCNEVLPSHNKYICYTCRKLLPVNDIFQDDTAKKLAGRIHVTFAASFLKFNKSGMVQKILHQLKYNNVPELGFYLGQEFRKHLNENNIYLPADGLVPVPLHPKKLKERGYNQAEVIARGLAEVHGPEVCTSYISRYKESKSQTKKGRSARLENMLECFRESSSANLQGKHIGIVDDVITTGATLEACCLCLQKAGVAKISVFSIASA